MRESKLWLWHIFTAVIILILLGVHMGTMHLSALARIFGSGSGDPVESSEVFHRSQQYIYMISYIALLGAALFHGLYGLRSILFELSLSKTMEKAIGGIFVFAGSALFIYGSYAAVVVFQMKEVARP
jgi:succinate dehydrogenase hydrophobic anchor subunit